MTARAPLAVAVALAVSGCVILHPREPEPRPDAGDWASARDAATRRYQLYDGLVHRATATATFLSPEVREARARRLAKWLAWTQDDLARRLEAERTEAAAFDDFVVAFYTADRTANDLDAMRSVWRIAVEVGGGELLPTNVTALDSDATITTLYPWVSPFDTVYRVRFAQPPDAPLAGRPFTLEIASALGRIPLDFGAKPGRIEFPRQAP